MRDDDPNLKISEDKPESSRVSRRDFLKISGISVAVPLVAGPQTVLAAGEEVPVHGPGKVPMEFTINGKSYKANLEPRVTLLDALRDEFELTGAKRVCDRADVAERSLSYAGLCMARCGTPHADRQAHHSCRFSRQSFRTGKVHL